MNWQSNRNLWIWVIAVVSAAVVAGIFLLDSPEKAMKTGEEYELPPLNRLEENIVLNPGLEKPSPGKTSQVTPSPLPTQTPAPPSDAEKLEEITAFWLYRGYAELGDRRQGEFLDQRTNEIFRLFKDEKREGVAALQLESATALMGLGTATVTLRRLTQSDYDLAEKRDRSPEDLAAQRTIYWEAHGRRNAYLGKKYAEETGAQMPKMPASEEESGNAVKRYKETHGKRFKEEMQAYTPRPGEILPTEPENDLEFRQVIDAYFRRNIEKRILKPTPPIPEADDITGAT